MSPPEQAPATRIFHIKTVLCPCSRREDPRTSHAVVLSSSDGIGTVLVPSTHAASLYDGCGSRIGQLLSRVPTPGNL